MDFHGRVLDSQNPPAIRVSMDSTTTSSSTSTHTTPAGSPYHQFPYLQSSSPITPATPPPAIAEQEESVHVDSQDNAAAEAPVNIPEGPENPVNNEPLNENASDQIGSIDQIAAVSDSGKFFYFIWHFPYFMQKTRQRLMEKRCQLKLPLLRVLKSSLHRLVLLQILISAALSLFFFLWFIKRDFTQSPTGGKPKDASKPNKIINTITNLVQAISSSKILDPTIPYLFLPQGAQNDILVAIYENEPSTIIAYTLR